MTDVGAAVISLIPSLTSLSLAHNVGVTDAALGHLARLTHLCSLNLTHSKITAHGVTALYGLTVGSCTPACCSSMSCVCSSSIRCSKVVLRAVSPSNR